MLSKFFIYRPNFAIVIAIVITLAGLVSLTAIPVAQYPNVTPPQVTISVNYPGASAQTVLNAIAEPIEEEVNGAPDMLYMQGSSSSSGQYQLTVTFAIGTNPYIDQVNVQNRVQIAESQLPTEVQSEGITVRAASSTFVLAVSLFSPTNKYSQIYISNYEYQHLYQVVSRLPGVGNTQIFGEREYAMRVWLNPVQMTGLGITPAMVTAAIEAQNLQVSAGQIGEAPTYNNQAQQLTVLAPGELSNVQQFKNIVIRATPNGGIVRLSDIARVQLAAEQYNNAAELDHLPASTLAVYEAPDANALAVSRDVQAAVKAMSVHFPPGMTYTVAYNASNFVSADIDEILRTLVITLILVVAVVYLFLQDWRATVIPTIAIPVSLIGVFAVLYVLGYSANTIDLFAIVLAITLVVDDAIVVVENVTRTLEENHGMSVADATEKAMAEITGPVIATTLVLVAVFAPVGFVSGVTGALYRQFAVTISVSVVISAINALTLSPALCALMLKPPKPVTFVGFRWFNSLFDFMRNRFGNVVGVLTRRLTLAIAGIIAVFVITYGVFEHTPTAFLPAEDQGYFLINVQLPNGASLERTNDVVDELTTILHKTSGVEHVIGVSGFSIVTGAQEPSGGLVIAILTPWSQRGRSESAEALMAKLKPTFNAIPSADIAAFDPPPIPGVSATGGINYVLEAQNGESVQQLAAAARGLIFAANQNKNLTNVFSGFDASQPQVEVSVNTTRAELLGVSPEVVYTTLQAYLGSQFVNLFNYDNFVYQVIVQADQQYRSKISDINNLYVQSSTGQEVPISSLVTIKNVTGPNALITYDEYPAVLINGQPAPGYSDGQAITAMDQVSAKTLPDGFGYDWTGMTYQQLLAMGQESSAFIFAVVFSFLFLVALYEGWFLPFAVTLPVGFALMGGLVALHLRGMPLDVYGQVGLVLLIGLSAKNSILVVEFAKDRLEKGGISIEHAGEEAARIRYRPVMMTALAFIIGVAPLVIATGAGAGARQSIGTTVFGGMVVATLVGVVFIAPLFVVAAKLSERLKRKKHAAEPAGSSLQRGPADHE
ncbi:efflux RND transporter permease subunit [Acidocella sp.]|jgi:multidrug efflux pump|uniref:efflux RND transporter permease subunit n=1 Tax=Acidocella sp. TaxID=50710 RepID=UPI002F404E92